MTQHVKTAYRRHRKRTWGIAFVVTVAAAGVAIPIASGAPDKPYTLAYSTAPTGSRTFCTGTSYSVVLRLSNKAKTQTLGSANITFPSFVSVTSSAITGGTPSPPATAEIAGQTVKLRNLSLPAKNGYADVTVSGSAWLAGGPTSLAAIVKQSNDFNDTGGDANLFDLQGTLPTITVEDCTTSIEGFVWNDRDENTALGAVGAEPRLEGWTVNVWDVGSASTSPAGSDTTDGDGSYKVEGLGTRSYVVCVQKPATETRSWGQTTPTTPQTQCSGAQEPNGIATGTLTASLTGRNFGLVETVSLGCGGSASSNSELSVQAGSGDNCKTGTSSLEYVYEKWTEGTSQYAAFHPVGTDGACDLSATTAGSCTYFVQKVIWSFSTNQQPDPADRSLKYDDKRDPTDGYEFEAMKYCKKDPRNGTDFGLPTLGAPATVASEILPDGVRNDGDAHTSCLITSTESANASGGITRVDFAFTTVDGRMLTP
jgi:hypothetical protein